jgi:hypothetical protein
MADTKTLIACGVALALSSACNRADRNRMANEARGHEGAPINLTGCLQKDTGITTSYILTQVNEPTRSVGTSGSTADPAVVDQERMREAKHAYRLGGDNDELEKLVGKQVKVQGTVAENSDLNKKPADADNNNRPDVDTGDLAKVDVVTIAQVADACGGAAR